MTNNIPFDIHDDLPWETPAGYTVIIDREFVNKSRWSIVWRTIISDGKRFFAITWSEGATEYQNNDSDVDVYEVYPEQVTTTFYKR